MCHSAKVRKGAGKLLRIRPGTFEPKFDLKRGRTKPKMPGTAPTDWHTTIPNDSKPILAGFAEDPILGSCEIPVFAK